GVAPRCNQLMRSTRSIYGRQNNLVLATLARASYRPLRVERRHAARVASAVRARRALRAPMAAYLASMPRGLGMLGCLGDLLQGSATLVSISDPLPALSQVQIGFANRLIHCPVGES